MHARRALMIPVAWMAFAGAASGQSLPPALSPPALYPPLTASEVAQATRLNDPYMPAPSVSSRYRMRASTPFMPVDPDSEYGFRNPGGVGRMREFYPPGNVFERGDDRVRTARFDNGPVANSREFQMMAQRIGNDRTRTLNQHIDAYGRPINFGFGMGYGLGFGGYGGGFNSGLGGGFNGSTTRFPN